MSTTRSASAAVALALAAAVLVHRARRSRRSTAVAWLQASLRVSDNEVIRRAARAGPSGLTIVFVCEPGAPRTAVAAFGRAAALALDRELQSCGSELT
eukprot:4769889-Prymnesium_polylepis.1